LSVKSREAIELGVKFPNFPSYEERTVLATYRSNGVRSMGSGAGARLGRGSPGWGLDPLPPQIGDLGVGCLGKRIAYPNKWPQRPLRFRKKPITQTSPTINILFFSKCKRKIKDMSSF
jgi:hypothetical protein